MEDFAGANTKRKYTWWENFSYSGIANKEDLFILQQLFFINTFSIFGFLSVFIFGIVHILGKNYQTGIPELIGGGILLLNLLMLRIRRNIPLARCILLLTQGTLLLIVLIQGGIAHTGIFWYFTFPIVAFFLTGRKRGMMWIAALYIATFFFMWLAAINQITIAYTFAEVRQLIISLFVVCSLVYLYQNAIEKTEREFTTHMNQLDKEKSEFVALASHQLRTPISAISWFTEMLLNGDSGSITEEQKDHLTQVYQSNQRMADLVDTLLQVSELEMGTFFPHPELVDIAQTGHKILQEEIKKQKTIKQLTIHEEYETTLPKVSIDPEIIKIIFKNLFSNAIKYSPPNGTVNVTILSSGQERNDSVNNKEKGMLIKVADTGYGIPEDQKKKIFTKLFRATNAKEKDTDGTGVGLYIVKSLVQMIEGKIWFESIESKGSTFFVLLQIKPLQNMKKPIVQNSKKEGVETHSFE